MLRISALIARVRVPTPSKTSEKSRRSAQRAYESGQRGKNVPSRTRSRATEGALKRGGHAAAGKGAIASQAKAAARRRDQADRSAARKAARTKGPAKRSAARKAARTRAARRDRPLSES
jgi:hypothetical protein